MVARLPVPGLRIGKLTVVREAEKRSGKRYWLCLCDCGKDFEVRHDNLARGAQISCGCYRENERLGRRLKFTDREAYRRWLWENRGTLYDADDVKRLHALIRRDLAFAGIMADGMSDVDGDEEVHDPGDGSAWARKFHGY